MNQPRQETSLEAEIRTHYGCKTCHHFHSGIEDSYHHNEKIWGGHFDVFLLKYDNGLEKHCFRWGRRNERKAGVKDIAKQIANSFQEALSVDMLNQPEEYDYYRLNGNRAKSIFDGKSVQRLELIGRFRVTEHSDGTFSICIIYKNALGGLNPKDATEYLSQREFDGIIQRESLFELSV